MAKQRDVKKSEQQIGKRGMTVQEAGSRGGLATTKSHGKSFYQEIGHRGGAKVAELIKKGKEASKVGSE